MEERYQAKTIEEKWQRTWANEKAFRVDEDAGKRKYYVLEMFPYPSGRIHMGHVRNYSIGDVGRLPTHARSERAPSDGLGRFRLPAENAASKGSAPEVWTREKSFI